ncbi:MAG: sugar transferase [Prevotellaceae bacterium]|jgi:lipopolysaccharide/colanic/teichoic acid biosynthesis glycosyltransferase|nr:sugar transferase [Prevotellaceae bacterium]
MILKHLFDKLFSFAGLLLLAPVLLVISVLIAVKMPDGGVIFRQKRVGRHGRLFTMYKFRTMTVNHNGSTVSVKGEARITPLGAFLRKNKLDELPELWNVFIGNMSFVGPRPDVPGYADRLQGEDRIILSVRPGITSLASLKYRNEEEILAAQANPQEYNDRVIYPDKVEINKKYVQNRTFCRDLQIIFHTVSGKKDLTIR